MMRVAVSMKLTLQHLGYEREAARCTEVTLDNLHLVVACQELNIERTGNIEFLRNLAADFLDAACRCKVNLLCREYQRSVTGVYTGKLYVLGDGVFHHFTVLGNSVELDFLGVLQDWDTTTGYSLDTSAAIFKKFSSSSSS